MANDKNFLIKNGLSVGTRYLQTGGTETAGSVGYNLEGAEYDSVSFSVAGQDSNPKGVVFSSDGTKMFVVGFVNDRIYSYSLSTAFDLSTASYDSVSKWVNPQESSPYSVAFSGDGTKMFIVGADTDSVHQYSLSSPYDLATSSYDSVSFSVAGQETVPAHVSFNASGTIMYIIGYTNNTIYQYSLSTAFDVSTASYNSVSFDPSSQVNQGTGVAFNADGTKLYVVDSFTSVTAFQYSLTSAYDVSTASYDNISLDFSNQDTEVASIAFSDNGSYLFIMGNATDTIYQYSTVGYTQTLDLSTGNYFSFTPSGATTVTFTNAPASGKAVGFAVEINGDGSTITWPTSVKWPSGVAPTATASKEVYSFVTVDGGASYYGKRAGQDIA